MTAPVTGALNLLRELGRERAGLLRGRGGAQATSLVARICPVFDVFAAVIGPSSAEFRQASRSDDVLS